MLKTLFSKFRSAKSSAPTLDEEFYKRAAKLKLEGRLVFMDAIKIGQAGGMLHGLGRPVIIELNSDGCTDEKVLAMLRTFISKLAEDTDVRMIARGTCASSAMFLMNGVPENCRYGTPGLKMWIDAGNFPDQIRRTLSPDQLKQAEVGLALGPKPFTMEDALRAKLFTTVLDVDWLD